VNDSAIILDYIYICERRGELLDLGDFLELWFSANAIAEDACLNGEPTPDLIDRILAGEA